MHVILQYHVRLTSVRAAYYNRRLWQHTVKIN